VPPLQLTKGQPPPIAANGGLPCTSFDRNGDAGTAAAAAAALRLLAEGKGQAATEMLEKAPPGLIVTEWGVGRFREANLLSLGWHKLFTPASATRKRLFRWLQKADD